MYGAMRGIVLAAIFWAVSTERLAFEEDFGVGSLKHRDRHVCNAVQIGAAFFITPAACLRGRDPVEVQLIATEDSSKATPNAQCNVTKYRSHPKYIFLSHNIALMQVQCGQRLDDAHSRRRLRDSKKGDRLILAGVNSSLRGVHTYLETRRCSVCQAEYAAFDCDRQICLKPGGKIFQKLATIEGLVGAGIFAPNAQLVGVLSYGFANGSLVAERVIYYQQFLRSTMQEFASGQE